MSETARTADAVARQSYGKLIAFLVSQTRDVVAAEDALAEAFASALAAWPVTGCPANPEAWLLTAARRKSIDGFRRLEREAAALERLLAMPEPDALEIPDERLGLIFACSHPAIDAQIRAPLILQVVLGLTAAQIAAAYLTAPEAMGKRLVRAKEKIREAGIPFRVPNLEELPARLEAVLDAIYTAYSVGWAEVGELANEALYLSQLVAELLPLESEALGLLSLLSHLHSRRRARQVDGVYVPLSDQETALWDIGLIGQAEQALRRAGELGGVGRFQIEAAIQSAHCCRRITGLPNWDAVVQLYDVLLSLTSSPVVALNRSVAIGELRGAAAGLSALPADSRLHGYQPYWAAQADLLQRVGLLDSAREAYVRAIELERDPAVCVFLQARLDRLLG